MKKALVGSVVIAAILGSIPVVIASAPPGRYTVSSGIVLDTKTALTWQQAASPSTMTFAAAATYCANSATGGTGWRLPSRKELLTLVDVSTPQGDAGIGGSIATLDLVAFPSTPATYFWSSTPSVATPSSTWLVNFAVGYSIDLPQSGAAHVRCVR